jgi:hypothetical protein
MGALTSFPPGDRCGSEGLFQMRRFERVQAGFPRRMFTVDIHGHSVENDESDADTKDCDEQLGWTFTGYPQLQSPSGKP